MPYRNANYTAFYVAEPFSENNLGAFQKPDFCNYQLLKSWKAKDSNFPFNDAHAKTYNVRDGSSWENTLKPRLRERLRNSKNIILILSSSTKSSRALTEEMEYGIGTLGLPVIVTYPEIDACKFNDCIPDEAQDLWCNLKAFDDLMFDVPTIHIPFKKQALQKALLDPDFMVQSKKSLGIYYYSHL